LLQNHTEPYYLTTFFKVCAFSQNLRHFWILIIILIILIILIIILNIIPKYERS